MFEKVKKFLATIGVVGVAILVFAVGRWTSPESPKETKTVIVNDSAEVQKWKDMALARETENAGLVAKAKRLVGLQKEEPAKISQSFVAETALDGFDEWVKHDSSLSKVQDNAARWLAHIYPYDLGWYLKVTKNEVSLLTLNPFLSGLNGKQFVRVYKWPRPTDEFELIGYGKVQDVETPGWRAIFEDPIVQYNGMWISLRYDFLRDPEIALGAEIQIFSRFSISPFIRSNPGVGVEVKAKL